MIFEDIDWNDGMLVCSSHLKNIKQVNFYNLFFLIGKKLKFFYGVISMELDTQQVLNGIIKINNTLCVMPDGSVIDFNVYNTSNQTLYIDLKNKNINNEQEQIICLSAFINNCVDQN